MNSENSGARRPVFKHPGLGAGYGKDQLRGLASSALEQLVAEVIMQRASTDRPFNMTPTVLATYRRSPIDSELSGQYLRLTSALQSGDPEYIAGPLTELLFDLLGLGVECGLPMVELWVACVDSRCRQRPYDPARQAETATQQKRDGAPQYARIVRTAEHHAFASEAERPDPALSPAPRPQPSRHTNIWVCPHCNIRNGYDVAVCVNCGNVLY